ncbi:MAG: hypothetical protein WAM17_15085, partial [Rhodoplanes sp.]
LQNNPEKIRSFYQNHRSNMPPDGAFTYGLINNVAPSDSRSVNCYGHGHLVCKFPINVTVPCRLNGNRSK